MDYHKILKKVHHYAIDIIENSSMARLAYHNRKHTESVSSFAGQMANHYQLGDRDYFIVVAAAWLHDLGYAENRIGHEQIGAEAGGKFLETLGLPTADIDAVKGCILATKMPQSPQGLLEQIVCDADLFHFGMHYFPEANKQIRKETEEVIHHKINKEDWRNKTIALLESHHYYTEYANNLQNEQKEKNLTELKEKSQAQEKSTKTEINSSPSNTLSVPEKSRSEEKHWKQKNEKPERGIETMFRISSSNHQRLSDMADNKAHIMITVNSIILSAVISLLLRKLDDNSYLMIPTFMLLATSLITIIFSILATRPSIPKGYFTKKDIDEKKVNLLFFGNYYRMNLPEYKEGMEKMMEDKEFLYGSLIMDGYAQGIVLGKKYQLLRISYSVFMFGLIISVIAFIIASAFYGK